MSVKNTNISIMSTSASKSATPISMSPVSKSLKNNSLANNQIIKSLSPSNSIFNLVPTKTLHITYNPSLIDRGDIYLLFREREGFDLIAFYDKFCFVRFLTPEQAGSALQSKIQPSGIVSYDAAKHTYEVPYPQPNDGNVASIALHITHLPTNYTREEMGKIFSVFQGFGEAHFYGKYGYIYFANHHSAMRARHVLRQETNLVVSYAKNPPKLSSQDVEASPVVRSSYGQSTQKTRYSVSANGDLLSNMNTGVFQLNGIRHQSNLLPHQLPNPNGVLHHTHQDYPKPVITQSQSLTAFHHKQFERPLNHSRTRKHSLPRIQVDNLMNSQFHQQKNFYNSGRPVALGINTSNSREMNPLSPDSCTSPILPFPLDDDLLNSSGIKNRIMSPPTAFHNPQIAPNEERKLHSFLASPPSTTIQSNSSNYGRSMSHGGLVTGFSFDQLYSQMGSLSLNRTNHNENVSQKVKSPLLNNLGRPSAPDNNNVSQVPPAAMSSAMSQSLPATAPLLNSTNSFANSNREVTNTESKIGWNESNPSENILTNPLQPMNSWNPLLYGSNINFGIWGDDQGFSSSL